MSFKVINNPPLAILRGKNIHAFKKENSRALDQSSMYWANRLLGNDKDKPILEISIGNLELLALDEMVIAVVGGDMPVFLNGKEIAMAHTHRVATGDVLSFKYFKKRLRSYIAVQGGFFASSSMEEVVMQASFSEESLTKQRTYNLHCGDVLHTNTKALRRVSASFIENNRLPQFASPLELRVVLSPALSAQARQSMLLLLQHRYKISMLSSSCQYYLKNVDLENDDRKFDKENQKSLEEKKLLENDLAKNEISHNTNNANFSITSFPMSYKNEDGSLEGEKTTDSESRVVKFSNFVPLYFDREKRTLVKILVEETNPDVADSFAKADGYILPMDASKLVQLPAGELVRLYPITETQALLVNQRFERFFDNHRRDAEHGKDDTTLVLDRQAKEVQEVVEFPLFEKARKVDEKINA